MKRLTAGILVAVLLWCLCACGKSADDPAVTTSEPTSGTTYEPTTENTTVPSVPEIEYPYETEDAVVIENDSFRISLSKTDGSVIDFYNKATKTNVNALEEPYYTFTYLVSDEYWTYYPTSLSLQNGTLQVVYDDGTQVEFVIEVFNFGFTIELKTSLPESLNRIAFSNLMTNCDFSEEPDSWRISGISMNTNTDPWYYPDGEEKGACAMAFPANGDTAGAKLGVVFSTFAQLKEGLIAVCDRIDPAVGLVSSKGGAYSQEVAQLYWDMVICESISADDASEMGALAALYGIDCINFHQGWGTFVQGSFNFVSALTQDELDAGIFGTASIFKERIANQILSQGVAIGLHTYSSLIDPAAIEIVTDPKWQQQLAYLETYTLKGDLTADATALFTEEDASEFVIPLSLVPWADMNTAYLLIDSEIVCVYSCDKTGFTYVSRGELGTVATEHTAGAEIRHLAGIYGMFHPMVDSELFYFVAQKTAEAYNNGGFSYIDLDGLEAISYFCDEERYWYYLAEFVHEILLYCDETPVIDYSTNTPSIWCGRGREGATDTPFRSYKNFVLSHAAYNHLVQRNLLTGCFGWMSFSPDWNQTLKNCIYKTLFQDDIDFLGAMAIAYDQSMIYLDFNQNMLDGVTNHAKNYAYYSLYSKLRKEGYFSEEVKEILRKGEYEYRIEQTESGYGFREMHYDTFRVLNLDRPTGKGDNPFGSQTPYIRVEGRYSSLGENEILVLPFDENAPIDQLQGAYDFESMDLSQNKAFLIRVYGNGQADAAVVVSIRSELLSEPGVVDFLIPLDHTGWKEFVLIDADNADYDHYDMEGFLLPIEVIDYETYRGFMEYEYVNNVTVTLIGNCEGAYLDDLRAAAVTDGAVKNPSVTIGDQTITFDTELRGGEYIEYDPVTGIATLYYYNADEALSAEIAYSGSITVPEGEFAFTYNAEGLSDAPVRGRVVVGVQGDLIENP